MNIEESASCGKCNLHRSVWYRGGGVPFQPLILSYLFWSALLRLILWFNFGIQEGVTSRQIPLIILVGVIQDLIALLFVLFPFQLLKLLPSKIIYRKSARILTQGAVFLILFSALFLFAAEYLFFDEFNARFNLVAVDYFAYPTEVFGNIWESYPVVFVIIGGIVFATLMLRLVWPSLSSFFVTPVGWHRRFFWTVFHAGACVAFLMWGSISYLTNLSNRVAGQISQNGILTFFEAVWTNDIEFDHFYATMKSDKAYTLMREILGNKGGTFTSSNIKDLNRRFAPRADGLGALNVVVIGEESLGAQYLGILGDRRGLTPYLDELGKESLLFENAFATGTRTVRGLEALAMSFPPIPSESTVKRPGNEGMANFAQVFNRLGYTSAFIYGGFGAFDNMNYFFGHNGYNLSDRLDIKRVTFSNIWGVCDEDLFFHAISKFDDLTAGPQPFFAFIMSTSNHKPFTFPVNTAGIPESGGGREAGVRYADYALGRFFNEAKNHDWYSRTLFVIVGDHDSRVYGKAQIPVEHFKIALLMFAPGRLAPRRIPNITSQIDVLPTVMGLLGLPYEGPFYGRDMLDSDAPLTQPVLLNHNHDVGIYLGDRLSVTSINRIEKTYVYDPSGKTKEVTADSKMLEVLTAYLQTAYEQYREHRYILP